MIQLFTLRFILFVTVALSCFNSIAQKKLLILGSSTSACYGPDSYDNCYVGRLQKHYQNIGTPITIDSRAVGGYNPYMGMPTGYNPPPGRDAPRPYFNISSGLEGNPDVVLVNYPSNGYDVFSVDEVLFCLRTIKQTANNAGKPCYITTSQPRSDPESFRTPAVRQKMAEIKERVLNEFGPFAINFWDGIVNPADNSILSIYDTDGVHLNSAGHAILFNRVLEKNIFNQPSPDNSPPTTPGNLRTVSSSNTSIGLSWGNSTDNTAVAGYEVYVNNNKQYTTSSSNITVDHLTPNTTYAFMVRAYDQAGNFSAFSNTVSASTSGAAPSGGGLTYRYYEGDWNLLPNFNALSPVKSGTTENIDLNARNRDDHFGIVWEGFINVPAAGDYTFELLSDDGSKLYFNSLYSPFADALVNNDGLHPEQSAYGTVYAPAAGSYPIAFTFYEKDGFQSMQAFWSGPGFERQRIPASAFTTAPLFTLNKEVYIGDPIYMEPGNTTANNSGNTIPFDADTRFDALVLKAYPNPFTDRFSIQVNTISSVSDVSIELTDYTGRLIHKQHFKKVPAGSNILNISTNNQQLVKGVYFVQMKVNGKAGKMLKMVKK